MKKFLPILSLGIFVALTLAACGETATTQKSPDATSNEPATRSTPSDTATMKDDRDFGMMTGVMMKEGKMVMLMNDGSVKPMTKDMTLSNGVVVTMSGKVMDTDGKEVKTLKKDEWVMANGKY